MKTGVQEEIKLLQDTVVTTGQYLLTLKLFFFQVPS